MERSNKFYKNNPDDKIWWIDTSDSDGKWLFSFDKKQIFNLFADYPQKLTPAQLEVFNEENPYWKEFFEERLVH